MEQIEDILIVDRDLVLDVASIPTNTHERSVIAQDLKHAIMDTGILVELIAERSPLKWAQNMTKLAELAEEDQRIIPGTVIVERDKVNPGRVFIFADTNLGQITLSGTTDDDLETVTQ
ncbi:DUF2590 family protein [Endozoicomonas ascidiicola]|uniref:DUF2590 family protein n=1 Tax=Endozoicomonas ascidiicola TaxID=1698521 RepID=UPI000829EA39|nr:DUF2590 family protein [Endozoicomonas ascidiicola]